MTDSSPSKERCNCPNGSYGIKHTTQCYETQIERLQQREYVMAQHDETGRYWSGPREDIPRRFDEVPERAEGGPAGLAVYSKEDAEALCAIAVAAYHKARQLSDEPPATPMGHEDAQSRILAAVHEIQVLCDGFGYDPNEWLRADDDRPAGNAWLVADSGSQGEHRFRKLKQGMSAWTLNPNEALQFSRRADAEKWAEEDEDGWHIFPVPGSAPPPSASEPPACPHPWSAIVFSHDGNPACVRCTVNLVVSEEQKPSEPPNDDHSAAIAVVNAAREAARVGWRDPLLLSEIRSALLVYDGLSPTKEEPLDIPDFLRNQENLRAERAAHEKEECRCYATLRVPFCPVHGDKPTSESVPCLCQPGQCLGVKPFSNAICKAGRAAETRDSHE